MVDLGNRHLHIEHDLRQHRHDDGLIVRRDEYAYAHGYEGDVRRHTVADAVQSVQTSPSPFNSGGKWAGTYRSRGVFRGFDYDFSLKKDSTMTRSASSTSDGVTAPVKRTSSR